MASFQSLLEQDKERFLSLLSKNTSTVAIIKDVEAEFDRLLYSFNNENENEDFVTQEIYEQFKIWLKKRLARIDFKTFL